MKLNVSWKAGLMASVVCFVALVACVAPAQPTVVPAKPPTAEPTRPPAKEAAKPSEKPAEKAAEKTAKAPEKPVEKAAEKPAAKVAMPPPLSPRVKVLVGDLQTSSDGPIYIALEKGFFREQGLDVELSTFDASGKMIPALSAGQIDIANSGTTVSLFNAFARGIDIKAVADHGRNNANHSAGSIGLRTDLVDRVKELKDLKGLKIALASRSGPSYAQLAKALAKGGLTTKDVETVEMGFADMLAALANKAVDAAMFTEPFGSQAVDRGLAVHWKRVHPDIYPDEQVGVLQYGPQFAQRQPEAAKRFMIAYIKGIRVYLDAFDKKVGLDEVIDILTKYTTLKNPAVYRALPMAGFDRNGYILVQHLIDDQEFFVTEGQIRPNEKADIGKMIDHSFVEYALSILGKE
ncbi:MAG: ABC transporter substrate-binding protein [Chloroflexi bacterium]|nr:ABC transporter substrate-binding protein [Chloroflexota bacterium]